VLAAVEMWPCTTVPGAKVRPKAQRRGHPCSHTDVGQGARMAGLHPEEHPEPAAQEPRPTSSALTLLFTAAAKAQERLHRQESARRCGRQRTGAILHTWNDVSGPSRLHAKFLHWPPLDADHPVAGLKPELSASPPDLTPGMRYSGSLQSPAKSGVQPWYRPTNPRP